MKLLKHFLLIGAMTTALSTLYAQETPPLKQRGNSTFQAVDDYLIAVKRLGIPTGTQDDLNAVVAAPNTAKIMFRTDINTLRVYNPVTGLWSNAVPSIDESNLLHKTGDEVKNGALTVNTLYAPNVSVNSAEPVGNFYVRGTSYLDASSTGGVTFWGVGGVDNKGGIITGEALQPALPGDNFNIVVKDLNHNGLLKTVSTESFIKSSPETPQLADVYLKGDITNEGGLDVTQQTDNLKHVLKVGKGDGLNGFVIGSYDTGSNFTGFERNFATPITYYTDQITKQGLKYRDTESYSNATALTLMPKEYVDNFSIQASPATPQNATIDIEGSGTFRGPINLLSGYNGGKSIFFGGDQLYYNEGWGLTWGRSIHTASLDITDEPGVAHSDFTILVRDNASGTVKKIELADLKAMLNAIQ